MPYLELAFSSPIGRRYASRQEMHYLWERVRSPEHPVFRDWVIVLQISIAELLVHRKGPDE